MKKYQNQMPQENGSRREFIKKIAYKAPVLIAMGQLVRPQQSEAGFGKPPSAPKGGGEPGNGWQ